MDLKEWVALLLPAGDYLTGSPSSTIEKKQQEPNQLVKNKKGYRRGWEGISQCMSRETEMQKIKRHGPKGTLSITQKHNISQFPQSML